jgi:ankyrin repeat protein
MAGGGIAYCHYPIDDGEDDFILQCRLSEAAFGGQWGFVERILKKKPEWANQCNPLGSSGYTILHQAAHYGASWPVLEMLNQYGADFAQKTAQGEDSLTIALARKNMVCRFGL